MNHLQAFKILNNYMDQYGLFNLGWKSDSMRAKRHLGRCSHDDKIIYLSWPLITVNSVEQMTDTSLHEIAHALVGPGHYHNQIWKNKAMQIGAKPMRCAVDSVEVEGKYKFTCMCPGKVYNFHRKITRTYRCRNCMCILVQKPY